jgi:ketosteroid isomerase-like protein
MRRAVRRRRHAGVPVRPAGSAAADAGREQIRRSLEPLWRQARQRGRRIAGYDPVVVHQTLDPEVIVAELTLRGVLQGRGDAYRMSYVHVYRVRDGRILSLRDYWNPLALAGPEAATQGVS